MAAFVEESFLEYCASLAAAVSDLANSLEGAKKLDRDFLAAVRGAAEEICVEAQRMIDKATENEVFDQDSSPIFRVIH
jgi:hypothetical protein